MAQVTCTFGNNSSANQGRCELVLFELSTLHGRPLCPRHIADARRFEAELRDKGEIVETRYRFCNAPTCLAAFTKTSTTLSCISCPERVHRRCALNSQVVDGIFKCDACSQPNAAEYVTAMEAARAEGVAQALATQAAAVMVPAPAAAPAPQAGDEARAHSEVLPLPTLPTATTKSKRATQAGRKRTIVTAHEDEERIESNSHLSHLTAIAQALQPEASQPAPKRKASKSRTSKAKSLKDDTNPYGDNNNNNIYTDPRPLSVSSFSSPPSEDDNNSSNDGEEGVDGRDNMIAKLRAKIRRLERSRSRSPATSARDHFYEAKHHARKEAQMERDAKIAREFADRDMRDATTHDDEMARRMQQEEDRMHQAHRARLAESQAAMARAIAKRAAAQDEIDAINATAGNLHRPLSIPASNDRAKDTNALPLDPRRAAYNNMERHPDRHTQPEVINAGLEAAAPPAAVTDAFAQPWWRKINADPTFDMCTFRRPPQVTAVAVDGEGKHVGFQDPYRLIDGWGFNHHSLRFLQMVGQPSTGAYGEAMSETLAPFLNYAYPLNKKNGLWTYVSPQSAPTPQQVSYFLKQTSDSMLLQVNNANHQLISTNYWNLHQAVEAYIRAHHDEPYGGASFARAVVTRHSGMLRRSDIMQTVADLFDKHDSSAFITVDGIYLKSNCPKSTFQDLNRLVATGVTVYSPAKPSAALGPAPAAIPATASLLSAVNAQAQNMYAPVASRMRYSRPNASQRQARATPTTATHASRPVPQHEYPAPPAGPIPPQQFASSAPPATRAINASRNGGFAGGNGNSNGFQNNNRGGGGGGFQPRR